MQRPLCEFLFEDLGVDKQGRGISGKNIQKFDVLAGKILFAFKAQKDKSLKFILPIKGYHHAVVQFFLKTEFPEWQIAAMFPQTIFMAGKHFHNLARVFGGYFNIGGCGIMFRIDAG